MSDGTMDALCQRVYRPKHLLGDVLDDQVAHKHVGCGPADKYGQPDCVDGRERQLFDLNRTFQETLFIE